MPPHAAYAAYTAFTAYTAYAAYAAYVTRAAHAASRNLLGVQQLATNISLKSLSNRVPRDTIIIEKQEKQMKRHDLGLLALHDS